MCKLHAPRNIKKTMVFAEEDNKKTKKGDEDAIRQYFKMGTGNILKKWYQEELLKRGSSFTKSEKKEFLVNLLCKLLSANEDNFIWEVNNESDSE